jgi:hypothetical protein
MARYLLSVHSVKGEPVPPMSAEEMQEFMRSVAALEAEMSSADALVYSGRLRGPEAATVVSVTGGKTLKTDGPFAETKEQLGGFYIVDATDIDQALMWAEKASACVQKPIEVRPFFEMPPT